MPKKERFRNSWLFPELMENAYLREESGDSKGYACVTLDAKIHMYDSTLRFSYLRRP